jgi:3-deoxy-D-manno-octulosonic-acid transferase
MYFIYTLFLAVCLLAVFPYYCLLRFRKYSPTLRERLGFLKVQLNRSIWIHAVSVGEVKAIEKLLEGLGKRLNDRPVVVSTITPTGQQLAKQSGHVHSTFYFPLDLPGCVRRALDRVRPEMVVMAETEIWPNFLRECRKRNIPVIMVNGRISDRSFPRYRLARRWLQTVLADYTLLGMQSETDRQRMAELGGDPRKLTVLGNLKFDVTPSDSPLEAGLSRALSNWDTIWIAASTMPDEEELVLDAFAEARLSHPKLKMVLAPRHPERCDLVEQIIRRRGLSFIRRTGLTSPPSGDAGLRSLEAKDGLILDTIGELAAVFEYATVVFMGGTLVPRGGHNILEPARHRKPVIFGRHMENFRDIARLFLDERAAIQVRNTAELAQAVHKLLSDAELAAQLGSAAQRIVVQNAGATERVLRILTPIEAGQ